MDAETKKEIVRRAKEIIQHQPTIGKSRVNEFLRAEFGVGLRSATVLTLKAAVAKEHPELRYRLYARGSVKVSLRDSYNALRGVGFLTWEAREFASQYTQGDFRKLVYIKKMLRWRRDYVGSQRRQGYGDKAIISKIIGLYHRRGWLTPEGILNPWDMLRYFRKRAIEAGDYIPQKKVFRDEKGGLRKILISKGDVVAQKARYRERKAIRLAGDEKEREKERQRRRAERERRRAREEH